LQYRDYIDKNEQEAFQTMAFAYIQLYNALKINKDELPLKVFTRITSHFVTEANEMQGNSRTFDEAFAATKQLLNDLSGWIPAQAFQDAAVDDATRSVEKAVLGATAAILGAAVGGVLGGFIGAMCGGGGAIPGAIIGAFIGALIAATLTVECHSTFFPRPRAKEFISQVAELKKIFDVGDVKAIANIPNSNGLPNLSEYVQQPKVISAHSKCS
jgi:hypothetical protein